jgi:hypothetical protein
VIVTVATNFDFINTFIQNDLKEEVHALASSINSTGKVLEPVSIMLFIFLLPIMVTIINLKGRC